MESRRTIKIKDLAEIAKVSTATVSRALNNPETVTKKTRDAVLKAAEETGYRINHAARNLRRQKTGAVVVLVPNLGNPFFSQILAGIESTLSQKDLSVLMVDTKQSSEQPRLFTQYLNNSRADGIICLDGSLPTDLMAEIQSRMDSLPIVFACEWYHVDIYPSARVNNRRGAALAINHLVELGHRDIAYIGGPHGNVLTDARLEGVMNAMNEHGLNAKEQWLFQGDFSPDSGALIAKEWLALEKHPTALFCANDEMAIGIMSELHRHGIRTPTDLSVIGFDDIDVARYFVPALTTISQPRLELGITAANLLIQRLQGEASTDSTTQTVLPVELVIRQSTARLFS